MRIHRTRGMNLDTNLARHHHDVVTTPDGDHSLPPLFLKYSKDNPAQQPIKWKAGTFWKAALSGHSALLVALENEAAENKGSIRRSFIHERAAGDPVELFLAAMAWGFGGKAPQWPALKKMLTPPYPEDGIAEIVAQTRGQGALAGWDALWRRPRRVPGLGMSFGTKLVYFAGYRADIARPRPLILDQYVQKSLVELRRAMPEIGITMPNPGKTVRRAHYMEYLALAEQWSSDPTWQGRGSPEAVEYALFDHGKRIKFRSNNR